MCPVIDGQCTSDKFARLDKVMQIASAEKYSLHLRIQRGFSYTWTIVELLDLDTADAEEAKTAGVHACGDQGTNQACVGRIGGNGLQGGCQRICCACCSLSWRVCEHSVHIHRPCGCGGAAAGS